jgi:hypothetical protein
MVAATNEKLNKSTFVMKVLEANPKANHTAVNQAWTDAGNTGAVSPTLVSNIRSQLGLAGNLRSRPKTTTSNGASRVEPRRAKAKAKKAAPKPRVSAEPRENGAQVEQAQVRKVRASERDRLLAEVEGDIDRLMYKLMRLGGLEAVEDALRSARRVVVRSHEA